MARNAKKGSPTRAGKAKPAKSVPRKKSGVPRKAASRPAAAKKAKPTKAKVAKGKPAKRATPRHDAAHEHHMDDIRRQVARRRPGSGPDDVLHEQKDPSIVAPPGPPVPPVDALRQNWGDTKEKAVTRNDKPQNWFRRAPKPPSK